MNKRYSILFAWLIRTGNSIQTGSENKTLSDKELDEFLGNLTRCSHATTVKRSKTKSRDGETRDYWFQTYDSDGFEIRTVTVMEM